jgi:hypothetical protein
VNTPFQRVPLDIGAHGHALSEKGFPIKIGDLGERLVPLDRYVRGLLQDLDLGAVSSAAGGCIRRRYGRAMPAVAPVFCRLG